MAYDPYMTWLVGKAGQSGLVSVSVIYFMPDHRSILNEFHWQTMDIRPEYPRVQKFIDYWKREIEAVIHEVRISDSHTGWRNAAGIFRLQ